MMQMYVHMRGQLVAHILVLKAQGVLCQRVAQDSSAPCGGQLSSSCFPLTFLGHLPAHDGSLASGFQFASG